MRTWLRVSISYAQRITTEDIAHHWDDIYETEISCDLVSKVTYAAVADMNSGQCRPPDPIYLVILKDATVLKVREGAVANRPVYVAIGISLHGQRDELEM